jgi:Protein of unknown function (DUF2939)
MRWTFRLAGFFLVVWAFFMASPFVALYRIGQAVEARDLDALEERVDFRALRLSLTKQVVNEYLRLIGRGEELGGLTRGAATNAGASIADPLVSHLVTPEALERLMRGSLPEQAGPSDRADGVKLDLTSVDQALRTFVASDSRGFANILVPVPPDRAAPEQYRLHLRFKGLTWRLHGIELPTPVVQDLAKRLPRAPSIRNPPDEPTFVKG